MFPFSIVNGPSPQTIKKLSLARSFEERAAADPGTCRGRGISNADPLALFSAAGGACPAVFDRVEPSEWEPTRPGPQPHNAGITPGRAGGANDAEPVKQAEFRKLADLLGQHGRDLDDLIEAVAGIVGGKAGA